METLFVSDLDGTLLRNDATLSEYSRQVLRDLIADGLKFTVASARSVVSIGMMLGGLRLNLPVVEMNGAFLSDLETGRHEVINSLEEAVARDICELLPAFGCVPFISTFNGKEDCVYYRDIVNEGMRWYLEDRLSKRDPRWRRTDDLFATLKEDVVCLTIIGERSAIGELHQAVLERHREAVVTHYFENQYSPGWYWLTIHHQRATKDRAIRLLMETYGLADHKLVVFGDQENDLDMFRTADHAVAVANAIPELKAHASEIIGSNEEDSVARYLLRVKGNELV